MKSLNEDLKTEEFKQVYLLYGEESYLKKLYKDKFIKGMLPQGDTMNYSYFEGKGIVVGEVIDLAETLPFFAERRLIVIENSGFFKHAVPEISDYIKALSGSSYFLFIESEIDKRSKLFKAVKDKGRVVELARQNESTLVKWIQSALAKEKKQMAEDVIRYFITMTGTDMEQIEKELEKLFSYTLKRSLITREDVDAICTVQITSQIFAMVDALAGKNQKQALFYYYDLLALKEPPMRILYLISRQFRILLEVKDLTKRGYGSKEIAAKAQIPPFAVGKYQKQMRSFKRREIREILEQSAESETQVKTGRLGDILAVELLIVKYSGNA